MANTITTQLTRELKSHPVKAGVLALLGVVALWFWAPLAVGIFTGEDEPTAADATSLVSPALPAARTGSETSASVEGHPQLSWSALVTLMDGDPLKQPLDELSFSRDPFSVPATSTANSGDLAGNPAGFPTQNIPGRPLPNNGEDVSLQNGDAGSSDQPVGPALMGTAIGASKRAAVIDGKPMQEGEFFVANNGQRYFVESISPRRVVLRLGNQTFELNQGEADSAQSASDGNVVIRRSAS